MNKLLITAAFALSFGTTASHACAMKRLHVKARPVLVVKSLKDAQRAERQGHMRTALRKYERAMNAKGDIKLKADAAFAAARLHLAAGHNGKAINRLNRAVGFNAQHGMAHATLAKLLARSGDVQAARTHLQLAQANGADIDAVIAAEKAIRASTTTALLQIGS